MIAGALRQKLNRALDDAGRDGGAPHIAVNRTDMIALATAAGTDAAWCAAAELGHRESADGVPELTKEIVVRSLDGSTGRFVCLRWRGTPLRWQ